MARSAYGTLYDGAKGGRRTAVTPKSASYNLGMRTIQRVISLGTGAVSTATYAVGALPAGGKVQEIRFHGLAAVTGTSLTAEVSKYDSTGATATTLQSAATNVAFASANAARAGVAASLTATAANLTAAEDLLLTVTVTADSVTAGPGDFVVAVDYFPSEDTRTDNAFQIGADLL